MLWILAMSTMMRGLSVWIWMIRGLAGLGNREGGPSTPNPTEER